MEGDSWERNWFNFLSDEVIIEILSYLPCVDICNVSLVDKKFERLCRERSVVRCSNFKRCYLLTDQKLKQYIRGSATNILKLNLSGCHWIPSRTLETLIPRCTRLEELRILHCILPTRKLCQMLAPLQHLRTLACSIQDPRLFHTICKTETNFQHVLKGLRILCLHFFHIVDNSPCINIEFCMDTTLFEHCSQLEEFHILGFPSGHKTVPNYVLKPHIVNQDGQRRLRVLGLNGNMDIHARILFFGYLQELCCLPLYLESLLLPTANLQQALNTDTFSLLQRGTNIRDLNISGTMMRMPCELCPINTMTKLRYLNVSDNVKIFSDDLEKIASCCPHLVSVNFQNSHNIIKLSPNKGFTRTVRGLQMLLWTCFGLQHLNLAGIHLHSFQEVRTSSMCDLIEHNGGVLSLALSDCCLVQLGNDGVLLSGKPKSLAESSTDSGSKKRVSHVPAKPMKETVDSCEIQKIVQSCPNMEEFELVGAAFKSSFNLRFGIAYQRTTFTSCRESRLVLDENLVAIGGWKKLKSLQLSGIQGPFSTEVIGEIADNCCQLERLYLAHICLSNRHNFPFILHTALPRFAALKDLRIEQVLMNLSHDFFEACAGCRNLQRLCVIASQSKLDIEAAEHFVSKAKNLVALHLLHGDTIVKSMQLLKSLKGLCADRPPWSCVVYPVEHHDLDSVLAPLPTYHLDEMIVLHSAVAAKPPKWPW